MGLTMPAAAAEGDRHVHLFVGKKNMTTADWGTFDGQYEAGILTTFAGKAWPVGIAADVFYSSKTALDFCGELGCYDDTVQTYELALGVRKIWRTEIVHLGLGGGIARIRASRGGEHDDHPPAGDGVGPWVSGSCFFQIGRRFDVGAHVRWSEADVTIPSEFSSVPDQQVDAGGWHAGVVLGFAW